MPTPWNRENDSKRTAIGNGKYLFMRESQYYLREYKIVGQTCHITDSKISNETYEELLNNKKEA